MDCVVVVHGIEFFPTHTPRPLPAGRERAGVREWGKNKTKLYQLGNQIKPLPVARRLDMNDLEMELSHKTARLAAVFFQ